MPDPSNSAEPDEKLTPAHPIHARARVPFVPILISVVSLVVSGLSLAVAWRVSGVQLKMLEVQSAKEKREVEMTDRARFTTPLDAARKIGDAVYLRPAVCSPTGITGIQRQPLTDRERRQLVALCLSCLKFADSGQASASEILEIAEYLYACGSFEKARTTFAFLNTAKPTISEQVDSQCLLALIFAAEGQHDSGKQEISRGQSLIADGFGKDVEHRIMVLRLLVSLGLVEMSENPARGATAETKTRIQSLFDGIPDSPQGESVKLAAERIVSGLVLPVDQPATAGGERRIVVDEIVAKKLLIISPDGTTEIGRISSDPVSSYLHHDRGNARPPSTLLFEVGQNSQGGGSIIVRHPSPSGVEIRAWKDETDIMLVDDEGQPARGSAHWRKKAK